MPFFFFATDPNYTSFHDEEWGVPVYDDGKLFELLVFSQALAELSWPAILNKRDTFRFLFLLPLFTKASNRGKKLHTNNLMFVCWFIWQETFWEFWPINHRTVYWEEVDVPESKWQPVAIWTKAPCSCRKC